MVLAGILIFLLTGQSNFFGGDFHLKTYMEDSAGMVANDPVRVNGILVGYIGAIKLSGSRDPKRTVEIDMVIQNKFLDQIPEDSKSAISSANLLGTKFVNITKGSHPKHVEPGGEIQALPTQDIPQILAQSSNLLDELQKIIGRADGLLAIVENGQGNVGKLIKDDALYNHFNETAAELEQLVKDVKNSNGTISHLLYDDQLYNDIRKPIQRIDDMLAQVQSGKGTLGKTMYDPQVYDEARATIGEAHADHPKSEYGDRQGQFRAGNDRATGGEPTTLRRHDRGDARVERADQGCPGRSEEVPAYQAGDLLEWKCEKERRWQRPPAVQDLLSMRTTSVSRTM
jgi:phospholipid/cholesterol/gamma-HCH transport system substrate-binding protein